MPCCYQPLDLGSPTSPEHSESVRLSPWLGAWASILLLPIIEGKDEIWGGGTGSLLHLVIHSVHTLSGERC